MRPIRTRLAISGLAVLGLAIAACGSEPEREAMSTYETPPESAETTVQEGASMTLTGCLQEASGNFVLQMETAGTAGAVGTSGSGSASAGSEHLTAARGSYRLDGDDDNIRPHVGSQVRVTGTLDERSELASGDRPDRTDLDTGDLAQLNITSITRIADTCDAGTSASPR
jgi:hypothetical protein